MNSNYTLVSQWSIGVPLAELWDALDSLLATSDPMVWWPSVRVTDYDGSVMTVRAASAFGYTVTFSLRDLTTRRPQSLSFNAAGDLRGSGDVTFAADGPTRCAMTIDWRVSVDRRWMRCTSWVLRPMFIAGHHLVMRQGEKHLNAWLTEENWRNSPDVV